MHASSMCYFISVNKLMLASFIHKGEVCKTDFDSIFCTVSCLFIKSYLGVRLSGSSYCRHDCKIFHMCLCECEIFILTFFVRDIY